jgi:hypothetical protein
MRLGRFIIAGALGLGGMPLALSACGATGSGHQEHVPKPQYRITYVGHAQRIVSVHLPGGPAFSILGQRYRFGGQNDVELQRRFAEPWRVDVQSNGGWGGVSSSLTDDQGIEVIQGCQVHPFAVIYGPLENNGDSLFVRTPGGMVPLHEVAIPQSLHMAGVFFYGVTTSVPSGFVVRARGGRVVHLMETASSRDGSSCAGGVEPRWVQSHVGRAKAPAVLARITKCLRRDGFEVGAQSEGSFFPGTATWRRYEAARDSCRLQAVQASS